jgi:hypothetical protein
LYRSVYRLLWLDSAGAASGGRCIDHPCLIAQRSAPAVSTDVLVRTLYRSVYRWSGRQATG